MIFCRIFSQQVFSNVHGIRIRRKLHLEIRDSREVSRKSNLMEKVVIERGLTYWVLKSQ